ncbi:MAG: polymer-forming cytoskeletal protein, partial [Cyanobacteria bacterium P01_H01_bin.121]
MFFFRRHPAAKPLLTTTLAEKSELDGTFRTEGNLVVDGIVHGDVESYGDMEISETGLVEGSEIRAANLTVHGIAKAKLLIQGCLHLSQSARLEGDILASSVNIEPGAFYVGYISITDPKALPAAQTNQPLGLSATQGQEGRSPGAAGFPL